MAPAKRNRRRRGSQDAGQLSFFDPLGEAEVIRREIRELDGRRAHLEDHRLSLEAGLARAQQRVEETEIIVELQALAARRLSQLGEGGFHAVIDDVEYTDRKEAGGELLRRLRYRTDRLLEIGTTDVLGRINGVEIKASVVATLPGSRLVLGPALITGPESQFYTPPDADLDFTLDEDPETVIERYETALRDVPQIAFSWVQGLDRARVEVAEFQRQIAELQAFEAGNRLDELLNAINRIESDAGGLFVAGPTGAHTDRVPPGNIDGGSDAVDANTEGSPSEPLRGAAQAVSGGETSGRLREDAEGESLGSLPAGPGDGGDVGLRGDGGGYAGPSGGDDRPSGEGPLHREHPAQHRGNHSGRDSSRAAVVLEAERRRDRASQNFRIGSANVIGSGTPKEKVAANIAAIRILKALTDENRSATGDEKAALVRYVGWGAFAQAIFDKSSASRNAHTWVAERQELANLLTTEEWEAARASTLNAHYTSEPVINGVWQAIAHLGFTGGRVIEPSMGVGHFIGLTPETLRDEIAWTGVEIDPITGGIAKALYPGADIRVQGFETATWPDGFFDLAISNVPFGDYSVRDTRYRPMSIHDYFFVRSLDKVREGGIVAFITSRYSLDKKSDGVRKEIAKRAEFLGAVRLPGGDKGAFAANAGTHVTTDIVFLRRLAASEEARNRSWLDLAEIHTPDGPTAVNRYFAENPHMMLGEMRLQRSMHSATDPVLVGPIDDLTVSIAAAARHMPANVFTPRGMGVVAAAMPTPVIDREGGEQQVKEGAFYRGSGVTYRKISGVGIEQTVSRADAAKLAQLIEIRDIVNDLLVKQASGDRDGRDGLRASLNRSYDTFHRRYGPISKTVVTVSTRTRSDGTAITIRRMPNFALFRDDPDAFKVAAIENYDPASDTATKAALFSHDIIQPAARPEVASAGDALAVSLNERGKVDINLIAELLDVSSDEAVDLLGEQIWLDPAGDIWRTSEDYLSGDVVGKLEDADVAAEIDDRYRRNVAALEAVQPAPLTRVDINVLFGAPWVPIEIYKTFLSEKLALDAGDLRLSEVTKKWVFTTKPAVPASSHAEFGTGRSTVIDVVLAALNNAEIRINDQDPDGKPIYNRLESEESNARVGSVRELFSGVVDDAGAGWIWEEEARAELLETLYNQKFNRLVPTRYDGSHLTLPGIVRYVKTQAGDIIPFKLRPHQQNAVWRVVSSGNTLLDHAVGAGKTFTMIAAGMEQKRLGLVQRPIYVVPNHMLEQFSREFLQAYPLAKLLVADKDSMSRNRRREFAARVAAERWDGIIITHDAFGRIRMSDAAYEQFIRAELDELEDFKTRAGEEEGTRSPTVKDLERAGKRLEVRLEKLINEERKDDGVTFEELAVDFVFVDEAHLFKNLGYRTRHSRVKGLSAVESQRATDLFLKIRHLEEVRPNRAAAFATGTPISNTIAEMYTMQRYLQLDTLRAYGIEDFDAWASTFGDIVSQVELAPNGRDYRTVRSFSRFVNIPELIALYSRIADTQTTDMLNLPRPKLRGGSIKLVEAQMSATEQVIMDHLVARAAAIQGKRSQKGGDNMLKILSEGLQLATDIRLLFPDAPFNDKGKVALAVENIYRVWAEGKDPALSQIVFLDMGVPGSKSTRRPAPETDGAMDSDVVIVPAAEEEANSEEEDVSPLTLAKFNLYEDLRGRLVERGVPRGEIAFVHEANSDDKKGALFAAVKRGEIRILIGSTGKMGVGTNVQDRLAAMHHLDAPWRPADVEQRDGRILRQGNLNPEVEIYRYITLRTLDAYRWQILLRKADFIAQIRAGARGVRTAGDIDSPLPEAAMIKAAATGDPRIMEHAELNKEVRLLEASRRGHERSASAARLAHKRVEGKIETLREQIAEARLDADGVLDLTGEAFRLTLSIADQRTTFTDRKAAGGVLAAHLLRKGQKHWDSAPDVEAVGEISGMAMRAFIRRWAGELQLTVQIVGRLSYSRGEWFRLNEDIDPVGLVRRYESLLRGVPQFVAGKEREFVAAEADLPRLARQLAAPAFPRQAELSAANLRLAELEAELQPKEPNQAEPQNVAEAEPSNSSHGIGMGLPTIDQPRGGPSMQRHILNDEWDNLTPELAALVPEVIAMALISGRPEGIQFGTNGEVYAFPHPGGGISWGVDNPINTARGVISGLELREEMLRFPTGIAALKVAPASGTRIDRDDHQENPSALAERQRDLLQLPADLRGQVNAGLLTLGEAKTIDQGNFPNGQPRTSPPERDATISIIHRFGRLIAESAGETPPRAAVVADLHEGLPELTGSRSAAEGAGVVDLSVVAARLEPHEFAHFDRLRAAGTDGAAFQAAFSRLEQDGSVLREGVVRIAEAYGAQPQPGDHRADALGNIETTFHGGGKATTQRSNGR